jgi:hypothetical protein
VPVLRNPITLVPLIGHLCLANDPQSAKQILMDLVQAGHTLRTDHYMHVLKGLLRKRKFDEVILSLA